MNRKVGYVIAGTIIFLAFFVTATRLLTPLLDKHRADFESWASQLLELPVKINHVRVSWYQYQPEISLNTVTILNKDTQAPILQIQKIRVFFSIPQSLWQHQFVPSGIMISGADVRIDQKPTGEVTLQGFPSLGGFNNQPYSHETKFTDVIGWLSQLPHLALNDIDLRYTSAGGVKRFLTLYHLRFDNTDSAHTVFGKAILHQDHPTEMTVNMRWEGKTVDLSKINANIYIFVADLSLAQWWKGYSWNGWQLNAGMANAKIWATWNEGQLQKIQSTFEAYGLDLFSITDKSSHKIGRLSGDIGWKREGENQIFAGDDIFIDLPSHLWPSTSFYLTLAPDAAGKFIPTALNFGYIDLADAKTFLFSSPHVLPEMVYQIFSNLHLQGEIKSISAIYTPNEMDMQHISLSGNFSHVNITPWEHFPGIKNISGLIKWNGKQGDLSLHSNQTLFQYDPLFPSDLTVDQLSGDILWELDQNKNWKVQLQSLQVFNIDAAINANGSLIILPNSELEADIRANFTMQNVDHIKRYLPVHLLDPSLLVWLNNAFLAGSIQSGDVILRGPLKDFPFDTESTTTNAPTNKPANGEFRVSAVTKNLHFHFAPDWPNFQNLNAKVLFLGRQIQIDVDHADIAGISLGQVHGNIPYLGSAHPQVLTVESGPIETDFSQALHFVHLSPLEKTIGRMFADAQMKGPMTLRLGLIVPFANPANVTVKGGIQFKDTQLHLVPWNLLAAKLHGQVEFTEKSTSATNIQGEVFNKPLQLNLETVQKSKDTSVIQAILANHIEMSDLENWLRVPFSKVVKGAADIKTSIDFSSNAPIEIHVVSDLLGVDVNLPDQYAKPPEIPRHFTADIKIDEKQPLRVKMIYDNLGAAALVLERKNHLFNLSSLDIHLGSGAPAWPAASGLYITGNLEQLDWDKIKEYLNQSQTNTMTNMQLKGIDLKIKKLGIPGQPLSSVHLQVTPLENHWDAILSSEEIDGQIQIPSKLIPTNVIVGQFQKLHLVATTDAPSLGKVDVKLLPALSLTANDVSYNNMKLGSVSVKTSHNPNGMSIESFTVSSPLIELKAEGDWTPSETRLHGKASSSNVSDLLNSLGFDVHNIVSSKGQVDFNLNWFAAPYALTLAAMNGNAAMNLGPGRIVELSQTTGAKMDLGRMLSIFSLQTIPRRLSFDFSDVFQKGYSFDSLRGDFKFENGNAYTNNTQFDGPVARVAISGRIGLAEKDYDFILSVTPYVTSSIPVAATLLTGQPVIGIAAWAVDKVISSGVSNVTTYYYHVTGPWSNPQWDSTNAPR